MLTCYLHGTPILVTDVSMSHPIWQADRPLRPLRRRQIDGPAQPRCPLSRPLAAEHFRHDPLAAARRNRRRRLLFPQSRRIQPAAARRANSSNVARYSAADTGTARC